MTLGEALRAERKRRGISMAGAARFFDVKQQTYTAWERGRVRPQMQRTAKIAEFLGQSIEEVGELSTELSPTELSPAQAPEPSVEDPEFVTPSYVAEKLAVVPKTVNRWIKEGYLPAVRTAGGHARIRKTDVDHLLEHGWGDLPSEDGEPADATDWYAAKLRTLAAEYAEAMIGRRLDHAEVLSHMLDCLPFEASKIALAVKTAISEDGSMPS